MKAFRTPHLVLLCIALFFAFLVWFDSTPAYTQADEDEIFQLTDEHLFPVDSYPSGFTELGDAVYFGIASERGGLWRTDMYLLNSGKIIDGPKMEASSQEHEAILQALLRRDPEAAEGLTIYHAQSLRKRFSDLFHLPEPA